MTSHLLTVEGDELEPTPDNVRRLLDSSARFWLDLAGLDETATTAFLRDTFGLHPLAVEDAEHFGQRPKFDTYDDFVLVVMYGVNPAGELTEVHCFYSDRYLVTVHREECPSLVELGERWHQRPVAHPDHVMLLYRVLDQLVDGYFPMLSRLDDEIDELEDEILARPTEEQLGRLFDMKRGLIALRKVVTPQRDMLARLTSDPDAIPGMTPDAERYFRDLYDHLIRISDLVDSYRDLMSGALDTHLSTVSNRLNVVMKQLTIIATVFLPLTFFTGFFGQNFGWMVDRINSFPVFVGVGIGLQVLTALFLLNSFRRRGWLSPNATTPGGTPMGRRSGSRATAWTTLHLRGAATRNGDLASTPPSTGSRTSAAS